METLKLDLSKIESFIPKLAVDALGAEMDRCNKMLEDGSGKGSDYLGWVNLPSSIANCELKAIKDAAADMASKVEIVVVIGIGGSYLGAKSMYDALTDTFSMLKKDRKAPIIVFAGQNISEDYTFELQEVLKDRQFGVIVISKSGTTTEPAMAFRILNDMLIAQHGKAGAAERVIAVTDADKGALRKMADADKFTSFVIPDDVGGRFSVLTPVGLVPLAAAGIDVDAMVRGAKDMEKLTGADVPFAKNIAAQYAAARTALYRSGKSIEILTSFEPKLTHVAEWWKQLYGESEGKEGKGLFPASVVFTTDLHSMGQYVQEGARIIFETVLSVGKPQHEVKIKADAENLDGLNFLAGKRVSEVNRMAQLGTMLAHVDGGVPNIIVEIPEINAYYMGAMIYFFERACGISGYALGVNPFDQPGVEAYKKNMFALLGKPGFEADGEALRKRL